MKRAIFLLMLFLCSTLAPAAFADVALPLSPRELQVQFADVKVRGGVGGIELVFYLSLPGECEYTLRAPHSGDNPGAMVAKGKLALADPKKTVLVEKVAIAPAPEESVTNRYHLEALCRRHVTEQTSFGPKETGRVEEVRRSHTFDLRRESLYRVTPVK